MTVILVAACATLIFWLGGGTHSHTGKALRPLQNVMNAGLRMISKASWELTTGKGVGFHTSTAALLLEFDLPSIRAICAGKTARALVKWKQMSKGWIRDLIVVQPPRVPSGLNWTNVWSRSELKYTYFDQVHRYVQALQDWHDRHGLVSSPPPLPP